MPRGNRAEEQSLMAAEADGFDSKPPRSGLVPARYMFAFLGCLGFINVYAMRVNLSVALVVMVSPNMTYSNESSECPAEVSGNNSKSSSEFDGEFFWNESVQGIILGAFFWGYVFTQIPGGRIAEVFSGKWLLFFGILCTAIFTLLTPIAARQGVGYLIAVRIAEGLGEGVTFPAMHSMISKWAPLNERSRLVTIIFTGSLLGTVLGIPISGYLCIKGFAGGWPSVFYVFGVCGIVWCVIWAVFAFDGPETHPWIHPDEKNYIIKSRSYKASKKAPPLPVKKMWKSLPLWAIIVAHFGQNWGFYTLLTELPTYLAKVLHFNMKDNSIYSALPYFTCWVFSLICSGVCDKLINAQKLSIRNARKIFNTIGLFVPAILLVVLTFAGCDQMLTFSILVIAMTINGGMYAGYQCNHIDIAPNFAGTLLGITNSIASIPGIIGPYVAGALTEGKQYRSQWAIVFYITSGIYTFASLFYILFARGEEQTWNRYTHESETNGTIPQTIQKKIELQP